MSTYSEHFQTWNDDLVLSSKCTYEEQRKTSKIPSQDNALVNSLMGVLQTKIDAHTILPCILNLPVEAENIWIGLAISCNCKLLDHHWVEAKTNLQNDRNNFS